jgi:hypothetical protein
MCPVFAIDSGIRRQVLRSSHYRNFFSNKMNQHRIQANQQGKNPVEACLLNDWNQIQTNPKPRFYADYYGNRMTELRYQGNLHTITPLEACVEHDYFRSHCEQHHDNSQICNGTVFGQTPLGAVETPGIGISESEDEKSRIDDAIEEAVFEAVQQM